MPNTTSSNRQKIGVFTLVMISASFMVSVRNLPMMAENGLRMIFFALIGAILFLVPTALVSAELATGWPKQGGVYAWVKEAFGERWGFVAIWLQWIQMVFGMVTVLSFIAGTLAFIVDPSLADNKPFILAVIVVVWWGATLLNMRGMKTSGLISTVCFITGVLIPGALIIALGAVYLAMGKPVQVDWSQSIIPELGDIRNLVMLTMFIFIFSGIELSAAHANDVINPKRNYPIAILLAAVLVFGINVVGALSVACVVPVKELSLVAGLMEAFSKFFARFQVLWLVPVVAVLVAFGATGQVSTWIVGPVKGLFVTGRTGDLPPVFHKERNGIPTNLLILQAFLVSIVGLVFVIVPSVNSAFFMVLDLTTLLYLIMYVLMLVAAIVLRYKEPDTPRTYKIPGGNTGIWLVGGLGLLTCLFAFVVGFFPSSQVPPNNIVFYETFLIAGVAVMVAAPLLIYRFRRPSWEPESPGPQPE